MPTHSPDLLTMIRALIEVPSVSSVDPSLDMGNREIIDLLASWLDDLGFHTEIMPVGSNSNKANLIATLGSGEDGLVLSGHTDTVPYDEGRWQSDPFRLGEVDNRLYGLGTSDMKAFFALAITAASEFAPRNLQQPLTILATADEESTMSGAKALSNAGRKLGRYVLIGEPTGLQPVYMHKGIFMEAIQVRGKSGHSSDPSLGASALEGMHRAISELIAWREELQRTHREPLFQVPVPTLNLGHIHGGDNPNRICAECELKIDLRPLPGMEIGELRETLHERIRAALRDSDLSVSFTPLFEGIPPMRTDTNSSIVRTAVALTGRPAGTAAFGTEGPYFNGLGMETVVLGPGDIDQAHQPDEYLPLDRIDPTLDLLRNLIRQFCVSGIPA